MNKERLLIYLTVFTIMGLSDAVIPVLPELAASGHAAYGAAASSFLFSAYFLGALITMLPFGILSDRYGNMRFIILGVFLTLISGMAIMVFTNLWLLAIARFVEGSACGAFFPAAYSILSDFKEKKRFIGEFNFLLNAGLATGVIVSGFLAQINIKSGILLFTVLAGGIFVLAIPKFKLSDHRPEKLGDSIMTETRFEIKRSFRTLIDTNFRKVWTMTFVLFGAPAVLVAFYPDYSTDFLTKAELGVSISSLYIAAMITSLMIGRTLVEHTTMIRIGIATAAIGTLIAIQYPLMGFATIGAGSGVAMVGLPIAVSHMRTDRGLSMGLFNTCTYGGLALMPIFAGLLIGELDFKGIFMLSAALLGISVFLQK